MVAAARPEASVQDAARVLHSIFPSQFFGASYTALPTSTASADSGIVLSGRRSRSLPSLVHTRRGKLLAATVVSFVIFVIAVPILGLGGGVQSAARRARWRVGREAYVAAVVQNPVEGLLDPEPIRRKCNETSFQSGLVWHCDLARGGIATQTNTWLNCLRYALEAGGLLCLFSVISSLSPPLSNLFSSQPPPSFCLASVLAMTTATSSTRAPI